MHIRTQLVYDLPTRIFHWLFAVLFVFSFSVAKFVDVESPLYVWHMKSGMVMSSLVFLRIIWGFVGSRHAKFSGFDLRPSNLYLYLKGTLIGDKRKWSGHNPASSWAAVCMLMMALCLGLTGFLMTSGPNKEDFEDFHEIFANGFFATALLHIAGVAFHSWRHRDAIGFSMFDGKKSDVPTECTIDKTHPFFAAFMVAALAFTFFTIQNRYNSEIGVLDLGIAKLQLGDKGNSMENDN